MRHLLRHSALWFTPLLLFGLGCQRPGPAVTGTPVAAVAGNPEWFTHFGDDGSYSVQFPKAPEQVGKGSGSVVMACPLDKVGSNLSLIVMPQPPNFSLESLSKNPQKLFGNAVKLEKSENTSIAGQPGLSVEMVAGKNRVWVSMFLHSGRLYQLVSLQAPASTKDFGLERQQFVSSFRLTNPAK